MGAQAPANLDKLLSIQPTAVRAIKVLNGTKEKKILREETYEKNTAYQRVHFLFSPFSS